MITDFRLADNDFNQIIKKILNTHTPKIKHEKFLGFIPAFFNYEKNILTQEQKICTQVILNKIFGFDLDNGFESSLNKVNNTVNSGAKPKF